MLTLARKWPQQKYYPDRALDRANPLIIWLPDLGFFDEETTRLEPIANPFEAKVSGINRYRCARNAHMDIGSPSRARTYDLRIDMASAGKRAQVFLPFEAS